MSSHHNISALPPPPNKKSKQKKKQNTHEEILKKIRRGVEKSNFMSGASIYRVPKWLYNLNKKAYTPRLVSIGPLHCKDQNLKTPMQDIKMNYVNSFLARMVEDSDERKLELLKQLIDEMQIIEETKESSLLTDARKCYAEEVDDDLDEEMLVIDGCFILELLYKFVENGSQKSHLHDPIFGSPLTFFAVQHDLLLLENQLPFSALDKLFLLTKNLMPTSSSMPSRDSLSEYVRFYFRNITNLGPGVDTTKSGPKKSCWKGETESVIVQVEKKEEDYFHILHILLDGFHSFVDGSKPVKKNRVLEALFIILRPLLKFFSRVFIFIPWSKGRDSGLKPTASELVEAGVKLLGCTDFEIKFYEADTTFAWCRRAGFEIPILTIDDSTELFFRNLIAFEQCYPGIEKRFTSYAALMDDLISTVKDVEVLEKAGVISDYLGSRQEVVDLFNKLCTDVVYDEVFKATYNQATAYTKRFWPNAIAHLRRDYFATPWTTVAFAVAFIVFGITVTKFIQSFLP
ncbi:unnamed protein product [Camellia sinensis]